MKKLIPILAAMAATAFISGCSSVNTVTRAENVGSPNIVNDRRITTDPGLEGNVSVIEVAEGQVSGNLAKIQVTLVNKTRRALTVNYLFEWRDLDGMQVSASSSTWKSLRLMGGEVRSISAVAPTPNAVDFMLKLQEP